MIDAGIGHYYLMSLKKAIILQEKIRVSQDLTLAHGRERISDE